jgi:hypothetical protein
MTIDGQPASSPQTLKVVNPATGQVFAGAGRRRLEPARGNPIGPQDRITWRRISHSLGLAVSRR